jgi:hypothetical protein
LSGDARQPAGPDSVFLRDARKKVNECNRAGGRSQETGVGRLKAQS